MNLIPRKLWTSGIVATALFASPSMAFSQITLTTPLTLSPSSPAPGQTTTATFTVRNASTSTISIPYFLAGARTASGQNVDFPASPAVTLAAGQSFTYQATRTFAATGSYSAWPSYFQGGSVWVNLASPSSFSVQSAPPHLSVITPVALSPASPVAGETVVASFILKNDGGSSLTIQYALVGVRDPSGMNVDFPAASAVTLAAGTSYTYRGSRTFSAGAHEQWPAVSVNGTWTELAPRSTFTVSPPTPAHVTVSTPLTLSPEKPIAGSEVSASFVLTNDGGSAADIETLLVGARNGSGVNIDFPPVGPLTLQPGASYTYRESRVLNGTGPFSLWPAASIAGNWVELGARVSVTTQSGCTVTPGGVQYGYFPPAQTVGGSRTNTFTVSAGQVHQTAWAETNGSAAANIDGAYAFPVDGWTSLVWRWADTMRQDAIRLVTGAGGSLAYRVELSPTDHASPGTDGDHPRAEFFSVDPAEDRRERTPPAANTLRAGDEYWATFAICIPEDFPENHRWATLVQRKLDNVAASTTETAWFTLNVHLDKVDIAIPGTPRTDYTYAQIATLSEIKNRWVQVTIHEKLSTAAGIFEFFVDGVRKASRIGQPTIADTSALYNFHYGYYRANEPASSQTAGPGTAVVYYSPFMIYRGAQPSVVPALR
jgi:hypothetical protein